MANKKSPVAFGRSELTEYKNRNFEFLRVCEAQGLQVKMTSIRCDGVELKGDVADRAEKYIQHHLPTAADLEGDHHGLGFAVLHQGVEATWLLIHWWAHAEICCFELAASVGTGEFAAVEAPFGPCVWEHIVINHEHQAWVRHMLNGAPNPQNYLNDVLAKGAY